MVVKKNQTDELLWGLMTSAEPTQIDSKQIKAHLKADNDQKDKATFIVEPF